MFRENSKVRLKSGGPVMLFSHFVAPQPVTLFGFPSPSGCFCIWFDGLGRKQSDWFVSDWLEARE